jgi:DNA-binding HxlR family transcriptional regulator
MCYRLARQSANLSSDTIVSIGVGPNRDAERIYRHFCMTARSLEVIGERWSLLIVRDLLLGPRRFSDLVRTLNPITPTRLTDRLRRLEAAEVVERQPAETGNEVWYRLTDAGLDLTPALDELTFWGIKHAKDRPRPDEPVPSDTAMIGTKVWLNKYSTPPPDGLAWVWRFPDDDDPYILRAVNGSWGLSRGEEDGAGVTVSATQRDWATFLTSPREKRRLPTKQISLKGNRSEVKRFAKSFGAELVRD